MASYSLLDPAIERDHRDDLIQGGAWLDVLTTRTPQSNWMIHPGWVQRLAWARLLSLARMVEGTMEEWIQTPAAFEGLRVVRKGSNSYNGRDVSFMTSHCSPA